MREINQGHWALIVIIMFFVFMGSCASIPELKVNYQLPPSSGEYRDKRVLLTIKDGRSNKDPLGQGAKSELSGFSGNFALSVTQHKGTEMEAGIYKVVGMMREGFRRRLKNIGLVPILEESGKGTRLLIVLNEFSLDRVGRDWIFRMGYEARILQDGKVLTRENVRGEGERYNFSGRAAAEKVLGEVFTDCVNRLDIKRLFERADLG